MPTLSAHFMPHQALGKTKCFVKIMWTECRYILNRLCLHLVLCLWKLETECALQHPIDFMLYIFLCSQNLQLLRYLLWLLGWNFHWHHPGHASDSQQLQAHIPGQGCTPR